MYAITSYCCGERGSSFVPLSWYCTVVVKGALLCRFYVAAAAMLEDTSGAVELHDILVHSSSCDQSGTEEKTQPVRSVSLRPAGVSIFLRPRGSFGAVLGCRWLPLLLSVVKFVGVEISVRSLQAPRHMSMVAMGSAACSRIDRNERRVLRCHEQSRIHSRIYFGNHIKSEGVRGVQLVKSSPTCSPRSTTIWTWYHLVLSRNPLGVCTLH